jgi:DNA polymerase-3 subunit epsilon
LKARGYRWNGEGSGAPRASSTDVVDDQRDAELAFLKAEIYRGEVEILTRSLLDCVATSIKSRR